MEIEAIRSAASVIQPGLHRTPVVTSRFYDRRTGARVHFKCENLQRTGSFKARGAYHAVLTLPDELAAKGVCAASSGNHGQALAWAARERGVTATIVMPASASPTKRSAVIGYGAQVVDCGDGDEARYATLREVEESTGAHRIDSHDDPRIIAGQGTAALELLEDVGDLDVILTPVGGGGLLSGTSVAAQAQCPEIRIYGCEPRNADDAARSFRDRTWYPSTNPQTIADGLKTSVGKRHCWPIVLERVTDIVVVTEEEIRGALTTFWQRCKLLIEPSSAVVVAALDKLELEGLRVGAILSGGNYTPKI